MIDQAHECQWERKDAHNDLMEEVLRKKLKMSESILAKM
jgi:hypothetical protein